MKKVLISGKGKEKINLLDILKIDDAEKQSQTTVQTTSNEQFRMRTVKQTKIQTSKDVFDIEQERSF